MVRRGIIRSPTQSCPRIPALDDSNQAPHDPSPDPPPPRSAPPGFREQLRATIAAAVRIVQAHVALARAELNAIAAEGKRFGTLSGVAAGLVLFALLFVPIGGMLFLGEWLFGSIGWGLLLGTELAIGGAVLLVSAALYVPSGTLVGRFVLALLAGVVVTIVLGLDLPHQAFVSIGASAFPSMDPGPRPLVVGLLIGAGVGLVAGLVIGLVKRRGLGGTVQLAIGLAILGLVIGALVAIDYSLNVTIALGLAVLLAVWPTLVGLDIRRDGVDIEALKNRFYPRMTVETTKETMEWLQKQRPLGPKS
jgi:hypothetical protein